MHFSRSSAIESWNQPRLKINSLTLYKMNFHTQNISKKLFFIWMGGKRFALARARMGTHPHWIEKKAFWKHFECKNSFCKNGQGIYLELGLVSALNGWTSQKMHEILLCLKFEAFVDVIWKSFLAGLITWLLNFFQIKYFAIVCSLKAKKQGFYFLQTLES